MITFGNIFENFSPMQGDLKYSSKNLAGSRAASPNLREVLCFKPFPMAQDWRKEMQDYILLKVAKLEMRAAEFEIDQEHLERKKAQLRRLYQATKQRTSNTSLA